jgi:hypothetical protein
MAPFSDTPAISLFSLIQFAQLLLTPESAPKSAKVPFCHCRVKD